MTFIAATVAAIVSALEADPPVCQMVRRTPIRPVPETVENAVDVRPAPKTAVVQETELPTGYPVSWTGAYQIECYVKTPSSMPADVAADALLEAVYARLFADPTLGGAVIHMEPVAITFDFDAGAYHPACAVLTINAHHRTVGASL